MTTGAEPPVSKPAGVWPPSEVTPAGRREELTPYESAVLEECNICAQEMGIPDQQLSTRFRAYDLDLGSNAKNVGTIDYANTILCLDKHDDGLHENIDSLKAVIAGREYTLFVKESGGGERQFILIRNTTPEVSEQDFDSGRSSIFLQYFDEKSGQFKELTLKKLKEFALSPVEDRILFLNKKISDEIPLVHEEETLEHESDQGLFYHERQTAGCCGIHAANAFFGRRVVIPSELEAYNINYYGMQTGVLGVKLAAGDHESRAAPPVTDATAGNNPATMRQYIIEEAINPSNEQIPEKFKNLSLRIIRPKGEEYQDILREIDQLDIDRIMIGTQKPLAHFVTLRKSQHGQWYLIDSLSEEQTVYVKISDFLERFGRDAYPEQDIFLLYLPSTIS